MQTSKQKEWYLKNKDKILKKQKERYYKDKVRFFIRSKVWIEKNKERHTAYIKNWSYLKRYGITTQKVKLLIEHQKNKCPICNNTLKNNFHVDHDHRTKKVRGVLCQRCNMGIGCLKENIHSLKRAVKYLKNENI